jgi:phosphoglycolate phosphatase
MVNLKEQINSIIFDLDGTLWDSTNVVLKAWNKVLTNEKIIKELISVQDLQSVFGLQHDHIGMKLFPYLSQKDRNLIMTKCYAEENITIKENGGELYSNIEEVIYKLSKIYDLYLVSNCQSGYIESFYEYHKMNKFFVDCECSGNTGNPKSDNIKLIIERNNIENPIYVGDTLGDFEAAQNNNIPFVLAEYGFGEVKNSPYIIKTIKDLLLLC